MTDFQFFTILFSRMGLPKAHTLQWVVGCLEGLNFTNDQHLRNSQNLHTSKKPTIQYSSDSLPVKFTELSKPSHKYSIVCLSHNKRLFNTARVC